MGRKPLKTHGFERKTTWDGASALTATRSRPVSCRRLPSGAFPGPEPGGQNPFDRTGKGLRRAPGRATVPAQIEQEQKEEEMKKVLIPTALDSVAKEILEKHGGYAVTQIPKADILKFAQENPDLHALIVRSEKITAEIIDAAPQLKAIVRAGAGYNTIDIAHARAKGVDVMNTPGANSNGVAEEVVALMLADARKLIPADASCRAGKWEKTAFMGTEITGKTIGIVGLGYIGRLVAKRLSGFEPTFLGYDPGITMRQAAELGVKLVSLDELFATSDYVTLHLPEIAETKGMVNRALLGQMKEGAVLINCARAGIVNEADLRAVKAEKKIRFLNDVYAKDEEGPKSVVDVADIMVPHLGASTREANYKAAELAAQELIDLDEKGIDKAVVNKAK
ncbi:MAG: hypothetical protein EOL90_10210 [Spartobacteria bacterium]|nr:hypothetical protein [Spartobacteria bacterium]